MNQSIRLILIDTIEPNCRYVCDIDAVEAMVSYIRETGHIDPVAVWFTGRCFRIFDGEKRWRACKKLGHRRIPAVIVDRGDDIG